MAPTGGIGPILPEHIVRVRMATEISRVEEEESSDVGVIGPLLPGNEVAEELRHISIQRNASVSQHLSFVHLCA